jgi:hypothetical protein
LEPILRAVYRVEVPDKDERALDSRQKGRDDDLEESAPLLTKNSSVRPVR